MEAVRQRLGQAETMSRPGPDQFVLHRGEAVLHDAPLRGQRGGVPGVVNVAEGKLLGRGEVWSMRNSSSRQ